MNTDRFEVSGYSSIIDTKLNTKTNGVIDPRDFTAALNDGRMSPHLFVWVHKDSRVSKEDKQGDK